MTSKQQETAQSAPSLATGAPLDAATFADFVKRLHHDCEGAGVEEHYTSNAIFIVEAKRIQYGVDTDYTDNRVILVSCDDAAWFTVQEYWDDADEEMRNALDAQSLSESGKEFMSADTHSQHAILDDLEEHSVVGWESSWEYVTAHLTKAAADHFVERRGHNYPHGLRVNVDSQYRAAEFNAIKDGLLSGLIKYVGPDVEVQP